MSIYPFFNASVADAFGAFPDPVRDQLLQARALIFDVVASHPELGHVEETLKWGQPSYNLPASKSGTPIRLGLTKSGSAAVFTHCQTKVMAEFQAIADPSFEFDGNRAFLLPEGEEVPKAALAQLIESALTYRRKLH